LLADYDLTLTAPEGTEAKHALRLIQAALQLSAPVLAVDANRLASQLHGRLIAQPSPAIQTLLRHAKGRSWWLRPLTCTLTPPGGALLRTLTGHTDVVNAVAVTPDGVTIVAGDELGHVHFLRMEQGEGQSPESGLSNGRV